MNAKRILIAVSTILFLLSLASAHGQTYTDLYNFGTNSGDPIQAQPGNIVQGRDGNLYSASERGGTDNFGSVFKITPSGELSVIYSFTSPGGMFPTGGLTLGADGNFYGTTQAGGTFGFGIVYKITSSGTFTVLHSFSGSDGSYPYSPPVEGIDGSFYGTTLDGGTAGKGTIYRVTLSGDVTTLYSFSGPDGSGPLSALLLGTDGNFYGTTVGGGANNAGTVFKFTREGALTSLHSFDAGASGPETPVVEGNDGAYYGTTPMSDDSIYKITSTGSFSVLYQFGNYSGGINPGSSMVLGTDAAFYGTAYMGGMNDNGTIYRITPQGNYSVMYTFDGTEGCCPFVTPVQHTSGLLYGDTYGGGTHNLGVFYSLDNNLEPFVSLLPFAGKPGSTIQVLGQGFTGATKVSFNGVPAKFRVIEDTFLGAIVPSEAKTGFVTVTTPGGMLKSNNKFVVIP